MHDSPTPLHSPAYLPRVIAGFALCCLSVTANAGLIVFDLEDVTNGGGFFGEILVDDDTQPAGTVLVTADVGPTENPDVTKADILGIFFDFADPTLYSNFSITTASVDTTVGGWTFGTTESFGTMPANNNMNGSGFSADLAISVNTNGGKGGFDQMASLLIMADGLDSSAFLGQGAGLRVQSIEGISTYTSGSAKLTGTGGGTTPTPVPSPAPLALLAIGVFALVASRRSRGVATAVRHA